MAANDKKTNKKDPKGLEKDKKASEIVTETNEKAAKPVAKPKRVKGRPKKVNPRKLAKDAIEYASTCSYPIVAEFAHLHGITREYLYELAANEKAKGFDDLSYGIKLISEEKEIMLEKNSALNLINPTVAIFSLKQLGWSDKKEVETTVSVDADEQTSGVIMIAPILEKESEDEKED